MLSFLFIFLDFVNRISNIADCSYHPFFIIILHEQIQYQQQAVRFGTFFLFQFLHQHQLLLQYHFQIL
jgi:hypothetical protein